MLDKNINKQKIETLNEDFQSTSTSTNKKKAGEWDTEESKSLFILFSKFITEYASETMGSRLAS